MSDQSSPRFPRGFGSGFGPLLGGGSSGQHMRVSDAERQAFADRLAEHYSEGRLDQAECSADVAPADRPDQLARQRAIGDAEHFDIYVGKMFERVVADQVGFLERHLVAGAAKTATAAR